MAAAFHLLCVFFFSVPVFSADPNYCDGIVDKNVEVARIGKPDVSDVTYVYEKQEHRFVNSHDVFQVCDDLRVNENPVYFPECYEPTAAAMTVLRVYIEAPRHFPGTDPVFTCVRILDRLEDETGGIPVITAGGVGFDYVNYTITGQFEMGIKHVVELYGRGTVTTTPSGGVRHLSGYMGLMVALGFVIRALL